MYTAGMNFGLGEDIDALRDTVRRSPRRRSRRSPPRSTATNALPDASSGAKLGELGLLGITVAEEYGGTGIGYLAHVRGDGGDQPRLGLGRPVLRRAFQPLRQPDQPLGHARRRSSTTCRSCCSGEHVGALAM